MELEICVVRAAVRTTVCNLQAFRYGSFRWGYNCCWRISICVCKLFLIKLIDQLTFLWDCHCLCLLICLHQGKGRLGRGRFGWEAQRIWDLRQCCHRRLVLGEIAAPLNCITAMHSKPLQERQLLHCLTLFFPPPNNNVCWPPIKAFIIKDVKQKRLRNIGCFKQIFKEIHTIIMTICIRGHHIQSFSSFKLQSRFLSVGISAVESDSINQTSVFFSLFFAYWKPNHTQQKLVLSKAVYSHKMVSLISVSKELIMERCEALPFCSQTCRLCVGHRALCFSLNTATVVHGDEPISVLHWYSSQRRRAGDSHKLLSLLSLISERCNPNLTLCQDTLVLALFA